MPVVELVKQLQSLVAGALPLLTTKIQILPFINPLIANEMWPVTSILAIVASGLTYNLARRFQKPRAARTLAIVGLATSLVSLTALLALVGDLFFAYNAALQDFTARALFVFLFVGIGASLGWCSVQIIR